MILDRNDHNSMHGLKLNDFVVNRLVSGNMYSGVAKLCHDSSTTGICRSSGRSAISIQKKKKKKSQKKRKKRGKNKKKEKKKK